MGQFSQPPPSTNQSSGGNQQKHDIFVGNLAFNTTEEQLYQAFSELGRIIKVRMVSDQETGKPRGFAFIEFEDPQAALSAIRNMNEYEINGRKIRVNFSNSSHLETLAEQMGMDLSHVGPKKDESTTTTQAQGGDGTQSSSAVAGSRAVATALKSMNKGEMYDVIAKLKEISDSNPEEARKILTQHPQLPEAILYCMSELDMIKTPVATSGIAVPLPAPGIAPPPPPAAPSDPRARAAPPPPVQPSDPRARPVDPRARPADPRAAAAGGAPNFPPPPAFAAPPSMPPPPIQQPPPQQQSGVAGLDPNLVQQVMQLTPAQISQLPPDKQQSILALRQQITSAGMR